MTEIIAAIVGACFSMVLMTASNVSNRKQRDTREIFNRLNKLEQQVAVVLNSRGDWRKRL